MKSILTTLTLLAATASFPLFASQYCPDTIVVEKGGTFVVPTGWHVTQQQINPISKMIGTTTEFFSALYNAKQQSNDLNHISCDFFGNEKHNQTFIEITTDQGGYPVPSTQGTKWLIESDVGACGFAGDAKPTDCPWG